MQGGGHVGGGVQGRCVPELLGSLCVVREAEAGMSLSLELR